MKIRVSKWHFWLATMAVLFASSYAAGAFYGYANLDSDHLILAAQNRGHAVELNGSACSIPGSGTGTCTFTASTVTPDPHGWPLDSSGNRLVTVAYSPSTRKITITATAGGSFDVWVRGTKYTVSSPYESAAHTATEGAWFFYHAGGGGWTWSQTFWNLHTYAPTAYVYWSSVGGTGAGYTELHGWDRDIGWHVQQHLAVGTMLISGGSLGDYSLDTDTDAAIQYSISEAVIVDEDNLYTATSKSDGPGYTIWRRSGISGYWTWTTGTSLPFLYGTYPQRNYDAGGGTGWTTADLSGLAGGQYLTSYVVVTPALDSSNQRFIVIPGQTAYTTQAAALAETPTGLSLGTLPFAEFTAVAQLVFHARNDFGGSAKAKLVAVTRLTGPRGSFTSTAAPANYVGKVAAANGDGIDYLYQKMSADTGQGLYLSLEGAPPSQTVQIHNTVGQIIAGSNVTITTGTGTSTATVTSISTTQTGTISASGGTSADEKVAAANGDGADYLNQKIEAGQGLYVSTTGSPPTQKVRVSPVVANLQSVDYLLGFSGSTMSSFTLASPGVWEHTSAIALTGSSYVESGITVSAGDRVLVAQPGTKGNPLRRCQASTNGQVNNGIFEVIEPGEAGVTKPKISRTGDASAETDFIDGMEALVRFGALYGGARARYKDFGSWTIDTDRICFDLYGGNGDVIIDETGLSLSDYTTNDATVSAHGFLPKLSGSVSDVLRGDGTYGSATVAEAIPYTLAYEIDFTAQASQSWSGSDGTATIDGKTWWIGNRSAAGTFNLGTSSRGLYIKASSTNSNHSGTTMTCPYAMVPLANLNSNLKAHLVSDIMVLLQMGYVTTPNANYDRFEAGIAYVTYGNGVVPNAAIQTSGVRVSQMSQYNTSYYNYGQHVGVMHNPGSDVYTSTLGCSAGSTCTAAQNLALYGNLDVYAFRITNLWFVDILWGSYGTSWPAFTDLTSGGNYVAPAASSGSAYRLPAVWVAVCSQNTNANADVNVTKMAVYRTGPTQ